MTYVKVNNPVAKSLDGLVKDFFNDFSPAVSKAVREDVLHFPPVNIIDTPDNYEVELFSPGFEKSDFVVKLENNLLTISAEKKEDSYNKDSKVIRREFSTRGFKRSFTIDDKIELNDIVAKYENGILKLTLPKREAAKAFSKDIAIS